MIQKFIKIGNQAVFFTKKHAPIILTTAAGVGVIATGVTSYKAAKRVEATLDKYDQKAAAGEEVTKAEVIREVAKDVAVPVVLGAASVGCLVGSYVIQNNRLAAVSAALSMAINEHNKYRSRAREILDEETFRKVDQPGEQSKVKVGKKEVEVTTPGEGDFFGKWFMKSTEYVKDDPNYNETFIRTVNDWAEERIATKGVLMYAELMEKFGFTHARQSLPFGWTDADRFYIEYTENQTWNEDTDTIQVEHYVSWATPRNLYAASKYN